MNLAVKRTLMIFVLLTAVGLLFLNSELAVGYYTPAASISADVGELFLSPSDMQIVNVQVENVGRTTWIPGGADDIMLSYRIFDKEKKSNVHEGERIRLPYTVKPQSKVVFDVPITAPDQPGEYVIVLDMMQEGSFWFADRGSHPLELPLEVYE